MRQRKFLLGLVLSCILSVSIFAAESPKKITFSGKVVDDANRPIAGTKVMLYQFTPEIGTQELSKPVTEEQVTKADGGFSFSAEALTDNQYRYALLIARKDGYAVGWDNWQMREDKTTTLPMGKPYTLSGVVVDEANKPVAGAEVRISVMFAGDPQGGPDKARYLISTEPSDLFVTNTGADGVFVFNDISAEAKAEFAIKKAGRAAISTWNPKPPAGYNPGQYNVQSKDIRIVQPIEAKIEGKVVEQGTGKPVGGVKLICMAKGGMSYGGKPVISKDDGTFSFDGIEAKTYTVMATDVMSQKEPAKWVVKPVTVTATAGQTSSGIILEASKGGILEVTIRDNEKKPVAGAGVNVSSKEDNMRGRSGISNAEGIAAIRLAPGEYTVQGWYKQGYSSSREPQTVTIEDGKTARLDIELRGASKITGVVRDPSGRALAGTSVKIYPAGQKTVDSDKDGRFEVLWNQEQWGNSQRPQPILIARHAGQNLAVVVDIDEDTKTVDVNMAPGVIFSGTVVNPNGKPITGAKVNVNLRISRQSTSLDEKGITTDQQGRYEYIAIPAEQKYGISAQANGYSHNYIGADADDAINNRLEIRPLTLKAATLSISGIVVDANDKPVANAEVSVNGDGQQYRRGTTDNNGKFVIDKLCEGQVQVNANIRNIGMGTIPMYGNVNTEAGATDVRVVLTRPGGEVMDAGEQPSGTLEIVVVDDANKPVAGANVSVCKKGSDRGRGEASNTKGIATFKFVPGEYELQGVYKECYSSKIKPRAVTIDEGKKTRLEVELKAAPRVAGIVRDPNGQPVARATIKICPDGSSTTNSDKEGGFDISWNPERWGSDQSPQPLLVARHVRRNLAAAVPIGENVKTVDVNMLPGIVFGGSVIDVNENPIGGAMVSMTLMVSNWGTSFDDGRTITDQQGRYENKAIPAGQRYTLFAQAEGYGQSYVEVDADSAVNNYLEIKPLILKTATMSISGIVVDINNIPVANAQIYVYGQGQQHRRGTTNAQGNFIINKLCDGEVQISADVRNDPIYLHGNVSAQAGDTDVTVVIMPPNSEKQSSVPQAKHSKQFEQAMKGLVTLQQCENKQKLEAEIDSAKRKVDHCGEGHVIVGKVVLDGEGDVRDVITQMEILPDGCFASATKDFVRPVGFRMHCYAPYDLQLNGMQGELVDVGIIHMTPLREDQTVSLKGKVVLEEKGDPSKAVLSLRVVNGVINTPDNSTSGRNYWPEPIKIQATETGDIEAAGFSPIEYYCSVEMPGCPEKAYGLKFETGQTYDLGTITLEKPRQIWLSYIVSAEPPFKLDDLQNVAIVGGTRWKAVDDESSFWDLEFRQDMGSILMKSSYGPCFLRDLGEGEIADYVHVDKTQVGRNEPRNEKAKNGHVYLLDQQSFKHWVLFKIVIN